MTPVYHISFFASKCIVEITANDFILFRKNAKNGISISAPCNTELVGEKNTFVISLYPVPLDTGELSKCSDMIFQGAIKKYGPDDIAAPETGELIHQIDFTTELLMAQSQESLVKDPTKLFPVTKTFELDSANINFSNRFIDAQIIPDKNVVLDYAMKLRDIIRFQRLQELYTEYKPKLDDYVLAYPSEFPDPTVWFNDFFNNTFFPGGPVTDFGRDDIEARSWCGGRVWEVFRKPYIPFFTNAGLTGTINSIELFVGIADGVLKIVR